MDAVERGRAGTGVRTVGPGPRDGVVRDGTLGVVAVPEGWVHVPPGDAAVTRRIKAAGEAWVVEEMRGRKRFSRGLWAPSATVDKVRRAVESEKSHPDYAKKLEAGRARREREQGEYVVEFTRHVLAFLAFAPVHGTLAETLARRVAEHATPVGSGTVARTERIPVAERAEAAVIAWMRHQTTAYDTMSIARVKGRRREVRRELAERSRSLLARYRRGEAVAADCPLMQALEHEPKPIENSRTRAPTVRHAAVAARLATRSESRNAAVPSHEQRAEGGLSGGLPHDEERTAEPVKTPLVASRVARAAVVQTATRSGPVARPEDDDADEGRRARMEAVRMRMQARAAAPRGPTKSR
jgi:hypothetical protein